LVKFDNIQAVGLIHIVTIFVSNNCINRIITKIEDDMDNRLLKSAQEQGIFHLDERRISTNLQDLHSSQLHEQTPK